MKTITFKYELGQTIKIKAIGMPGQIDALSFGPNGEEFRVVYWNNGQRYSVWMYDWEIDL
jgi:hypothetical protein